MHMSLLYIYQRAFPSTYGRARVVLAQSNETPSHAPLRIG